MLETVAVGINDSTTRQQLEVLFGKAGTITDLNVRQLATFNAAEGTVKSKAGCTAVKFNGLVLIGFEFDLIGFVDLTVNVLGITSEIGCFDIDRVNRLVLVGFEFELTVVGFNTLNAWIQLDTLAIGSEFKDLICWCVGFNDLVIWKCWGTLSLALVRDDTKLGSNDSIVRQQQLEWGVSWCGGFNDLTTWQHLLYCSH